jgi:hypothetical protein
MSGRSRIVAGLAFLVIAWGARAALTQETNSASVIINVPADAASTSTMSAARTSITAGEGTRSSIVP